MKLLLEGIEHHVDIIARQPSLRCRVDGREYSVSEATGLGDDCALLVVDGRQYTVWRAAEGDRIHVKLGSRSFSITLDDPLSSTRSGNSADELRADMPGVVVATRCQVGDVVEAGAPLLTIESMKMQITLSAPRAGVVAVVHFGMNDTFQKGAVLIALQAEIGEERST
jgi:biotin carboxyl carrier protein